ncbi:MAG: DUF5714 domain-containing protein [Clostridia bacterium]|nr:DUF5714 domain-containing protein [Clostridia bacterium]
MEEQKTGCLVCGASLEYLQSQIEMECTCCHKKFMSNARCVKGHFICDSCHEQMGLRVIEDICRHTDSRDPMAIMKKIILSPYIYMHGPEHHVLVGSVLLAAYKNAGGELDLDAALEEMRNRGTQVPGGICGLWGTCGAAVSTGIFISLITGASPLSGKEWGLCNEMTSRSLGAIAKTGGPRCCKRDSYTAILQAVDFVGEKFGIWMERPQKTVCGLSDRNEQCLKEKCPYNPLG